MNFNLSDAVNAKEGGKALTAGIKDATFMGVSFEKKTSQKTNETYNVMSLKLDIDGYGEYTQSFFEPQSAERQEMQWGPSASQLDHFKIIMTEILEAINPQVIKDIQNGTKTLSGNFKQVVDSLAAFTKDMIGVTRVQVKLIPQNNGFVAMPQYVARITKSGELGIATRIIGQNLTLTPSEVKKIEAANTASPTNMASVSSTKDTVESMLDDFTEDNNNDNDLPF